MTSQEIIDRFNAPETTCIYGYAFGDEYLQYADGRMEKDTVIKINKQDTTMYPEREFILYVWGYPGPDSNKYKFSDYGRTWSFDEVDLSQD